MNIVRCYNDGGQYYDPDNLEDEWLTGCPVCGVVCSLPPEEVARIYKELDLEREGVIYEHVCKGRVLGKRTKKV